MNNQINIDLNQTNPISIDIDKKRDIDIQLDDNQTIRSYPPLADKPLINGNLLLGNKTGSELGLEDKLDVITEQEIDYIIYGG